MALLGCQVQCIKTILIAGADVHSSFQIFQNLVDVPCPRRSQETGVTVRLLGSLSPLSQPIEAIAGVQPVVGVVVLTHSFLKQPLFPFPFIPLFFFFSSLYPLVLSRSTSSVN